MNCNFFILNESEDLLKWYDPAETGAIPVDVVKKKGSNSGRIAPSEFYLFFFKTGWNQNAVDNMNHAIRTIQVGSFYCHISIEGNSFV